MTPFEDVKPGQRQLSARELKAAGRMIARGQPAAAAGDGAAAVRRLAPGGVADLRNDRGEMFLVRVTEVGDQAGDLTRYAFEEVCVYHRKEYAAGTYVHTAEVETVQGGRIATLDHNPAFCLTDTPLAVGDVCAARRSLRSPYAWELFPGGGGSDGSFWGRLVAKSPGTCPTYTYERLAEPGSGSGAESGSGGGDCSGLEPTGVTGTATEVNGVDVPVPPGWPDATEADLRHAVVVRLFPAGGESGSGGGESGSGGSGPACLFRMNPRWEFVEKTGDPDENGIAPGVLLAWDGAAFVPVESVYVIDANEN